MQRKSAELREVKGGGVEGGRTGRGKGETLGRGYIRWNQKGRREIRESAKRFLADICKLRTFNPEISANRVNIPDAIYVHIYVYTAGGNLGIYLSIQTPYMCSLIVLGNRYTCSLIVHGNPYTFSLIVHANPYTCGFFIHGNTYTCSLFVHADPIHV